MFTGEADLPESSKSLTLLTVNLVLSSSRPMHQSQISEDVTLNCEVWGVHDGMEVEWYFQKEGRGKKLFPGEESHISMEQGVEKSGDLSLTVRGVRVQDEGTYICSVKAERHKIQQILQLQIRQPPKVTVIQNASPTIDLICRTDRYFPLDVKIDWLLNGVPIPNPDLESSSHRRNSDGTYNLTNILKVPAPAGETVPDIYTCSVSHVSVEEPILMNISITSPDIQSKTSYISAVNQVPCSQKLFFSCNMVNLFIVTSVPFTFVLVIIIWIKIHKTRREEKKMV
ncbi:hypothetical protein GDO86_010138 [Hymenochirus boettgeri]|uniref:Ig-like domain-containing protein n=1 Tax=Hymenochirus boettgeri TaxID=247094 RepID=A0A8T2JRQ7_9PIPI|nr:hypothetical protein GDO86_010138 [Hymenochirus boettgeri]